MRRIDEKGDLLIALVLVSALLLGSIGFGVWAFMGRQDYKNNSDAKSAEAVKAAEEALSLKKDQEYAEASKRPYSTYTGPSALGTVSISYPKTWSIYADERGQGQEPLNGFMHPNYVPADTNVNYALRFQVMERTYDEALRLMDSSIRTGKVTVAGYRLPKMPDVAGSRLEGEVVTAGRKQGVMIMMPLRDKTVKIWTEGNEFRADFQEILNQITFVP